MEDEGDIVALDPSALRPVAWPLNLPDEEETRRLLLEEVLPPPELAEVTERIIRGLTPLEVSALRGTENSESGQWLRRAAIMRWRLIAAQATRPVDVEAIDSQGVSQLVEVSTDLIRTEDLPATSDRARGALVKALVDFGRKPSSAPPPPEPLLQAPRPDGQAALPKEKPAREAPRALALDGSPRGLQRSLGIVLALVVAAGVVFHLVWYYQRHPPLRPPLEGMPAGTVGAIDSSTGVTIVRLEEPAVRNELLEALEKQAKEKDLSITEPAPGVFMLVPRAANVAVPPKLQADKAAPPNR
jgi:hypothetical protein